MTKCRKKTAEETDRVVTTSASRAMDGDLHDTSNCTSYYHPLLPYYYLTTNLLLLHTTHYTLHATPTHPLTTHGILPLTAPTTYDTRAVAPGRQSKQTTQPSRRPLLSSTHGQITNAGASTNCLNRLLFLIDGATGRARGP